MAPQPLSIFEKALNCPPRPPSKRSPKFTELHSLVAPTMYGGRAMGSSAPRKILSARRLCADEHPALGGPGTYVCVKWLSRLCLSSSCSFPFTLPQFFSRNFRARMAYEQRSPTRLTHTIPCFAAPQPFSPEQTGGVSRV